MCCNMPSSCWIHNPDCAFTTPTAPLLAIRVVFEALHNSVTAPVLAFFVRLLFPQLQRPFHGLLDVVHALHHVPSEAARGVGDLEFADITDNLPAELFDVIHIP